MTPMTIEASESSYSYTLAKVPALWNSSSEASTTEITLSAIVKHLNTFKDVLLLPEFKHVVAVFKRSLKHLNSFCCG